MIFFLAVLIAPSNTEQLAGHKGQVCANILQYRALQCKGHFPRSQMLTILCCLYL